jgi:hypothetical protein
LPAKIATEYVGPFLGWIPGTTVSKRAGLRHPDRHGRRIHIRDLIPHKDAWLRLMQETVAKIKEALGEEE